MKDKSKKTRPAKENDLTRRKFIAGAAASGALFSQACSIVPRHVLGGAGYVSPSEKLNIGIIGAGGKGNADVNFLASENIIALCDVDDERAAKTHAEFPQARRYHDYREMLAQESELDAVTVTTPDHTHAVASIAAMKLGLHVYCQKPLTFSIYETRVMQAAAKKYGIVTQMGNQGTALDGLREAVEVIQSGAIGKVRHAHVWTNRPVWPQAIDRPTEKTDIPDTLKWNLWQSVAERRPYNPIYAPFNWRGWLDYGTGALGDMACHTANMAFMALKLDKRPPTAIEAKTSTLFAETFPAWSIINFEFPSLGDMPELTFTWYDGGKLPPEELFMGEEISSSGSLLVGDDGILYSPNDYGAEYLLLPESQFKDYETPDPWLPRLPGSDELAHHMEWVNACKGGPTPMSNFDYAAPLTGIVLLGNVAMRAGHRIKWSDWDMRVSNCGYANGYLKRDFQNGYAL